MASSAQFIPYVDDTYHDSGYVGGEHRLVVELTVPDASDVSGVAERKIVASGAVQAQDASTTNTSKRTVTGSGALQDTDSSITDVVGNGERSVVTVVSAAEVDDPSTVTGVAERTVNASGTPQAQASAVVGATEITSNGSGTPQAQASTISATANIGRTTSADLEAQSSSMGSSSAEREITQVGSSAFKPTDNNNVSGEGTTAKGVLSGVEQVSASVVVGAAERIIDDQGGITITAESSTVTSSITITFNTEPVTLEAQSSSMGSSSAEREIVQVGSAAFKPTNNNVVAGVAERDITGSGAIQASGVVIFGVAERTVVETDASVSAQSSTVSAVVEISSVGSGALQPTTNNEVSGAAEREIVQVGSAAFKPTDNNNVSGQGTAGKQASGALQPTTNNEVSGVAEREVVASGTPQAQASSITSSSEREVVGSGALTVTDQDGQKGEAEREIDDNGATFALKPTDNNNVTGAAERVITANGALQDTDASITDVAGNGERSVVTVISAAEVDSPSQVEATINVGRDTSVTLEAQDATVTASTIKHSNQVGTASLQPSANNEVSGVAERKVTSSAPVVQTDREINVSGVAERVINPSVAIQAQESTVDATVEVAKLIGGTLATSGSVVSGQAEREIRTSVTLQPSENNVVSGVAENKITGSGVLGAVGHGVGGVAERTVEDNTIPQALATAEVVVSGTAERKVVSVTAVLASQDVEVIGLSEREIETNNISQDLVTGSSTVTGLAERIIDDEGQLDLDINAQSSQVVGVAERTVLVASGVPDSNGVATLEAQSSTTTSVTKRTVFVIEANLTASEVGLSEVEGQAQRQEITEAVPLVKAFRIKKPKLSTITIRRPLGQVEV